MLYFEASSIFNVHLFRGNQSMCIVHSSLCDLVNMQFYVLKKYYSSLLNSIRAHALILCVKYTTEFFLCMFCIQICCIFVIFVKSLFSFFQKISLHILNILEIAGAFLHGGIYVLFAFSNISTPSNIL